MTTQTMQIPQHSSPLRILIVVPAAMTITFGLFTLMDQLTHSGGVPEAPPASVVIDDFTFQARPEQLIVEPKLIKPPELPTLPKREQLQPDPNAAPDPGAKLVKFVPETVATAVSPKLGFTEGAASPMVRMEPKYPAAAARDGVEGWVKLVFSIDGSGQVFDIQVIDAQPKRTFDREARRALSKWKYKPQIVQGKPTVQTGMEVVLEFKLEQG